MGVNLKQRLKIGGGGGGGRQEESAKRATLNTK